MGSIRGMLLPKQDLLDEVFSRAPSLPMPRARSRAVSSRRASAQASQAVASSRGSGVHEADPSGAPVQQADHAVGPAVPAVPAAMHLGDLRRVAARRQTMGAAAAAELGPPIVTARRQSLGAAMNVTLAEARPASGPTALDGLGATATAGADADAGPPLPAIPRGTSGTGTGTGELGQSDRIAEAGVSGAMLEDPAEASRQLDEWALDTGTLTDQELKASAALGRALCSRLPYFCPEEKGRL